MLFMANGVTMLHAQYRFDNILYGAAYYHEYMPSERLDEDVRLMKEYGVNVVRVGESSWGIFEPQEGVFKFEWMDRILFWVLLLILFPLGWQKGILKFWHNILVEDRHIMVSGKI